MLLDQWGNPIDLTRLKSEEAGPTLTGVRQILGGHPAEGLTPQRLGRLLREAEDGDPTAYLELAEQMEEKDLHYRSVLSTRKNQVAGLEISVEAATDEADDVKAADLVRDVLWTDTLAEDLFDVLDAIGKGFSVTEIIWDTEGRAWRPVRLEWRDPRWFRFDPADGRTICLLDAGGALTPLKPFGYLTHVHKSKSGLPIRGGLARPTAWFYLFKNFGIRSWVEFSEGYGKPLRLGKYHQGATEPEKATLLRAVRSLLSDAGGIIPDTMKIDLVEAKLSGNLDLYERMADWFDRQVSKAVLGQTGTTDVGQHVGTANAHERVRQDIEEADARQLAASLNRDLVRPIVDLNMGPRARYPRIRVFRADAEDVTTLVKNLSTLVPLGLRVEQSWIADKMGIPDAADGARLLAAPQPAAPGPDPEALAAQAQAAGDPGGDAIDDLVDREMNDGWREVMDPVREHIQALLDECGSAEEFLARLPELAGDLPMDKLTDSLARTMFAARAAGETGDGLG